MAVSLIWLPVEYRFETKQCTGNNNLVRNEMNSFIISSNPIVTNLYLKHSLIFLDCLD